MKDHTKPTKVKMSATEYEEFQQFKRNKKGLVDVSAEEDDDDDEDEGGAPLGDKQGGGNYVNEQEEVDKLMAGTNTGADAEMNMEGLATANTTGTKV